MLGQIRGIQKYFEYHACHVLQACTRMHPGVLGVCHKFAAQASHLRPTLTSNQYGSKKRHTRAYKRQPSSHS